MRAVIVDCAIYRDGRRTDGPADFSDALDEARATGDAFLWIGLHEPTEKEFDLVSSEFGLHPLAVEDALSAHQRPKLEVYDDSLFLVLKPVVYDAESDTVTAGELMVFVGDSFVVTVRHGEGAPLARRTAAGWRRSPRCSGTGRPRCCTRSPTRSSTTTWRWPPSSRPTWRSWRRRSSRPTGGGHARTPRRRIYTFKRQVLEFRRATGPLARAAWPGSAGAGGAVRRTSSSQPFFRDVSDHLTRVNEQVEGLDRLLPTSCPPIWRRWACGRTTTCGRSRRGRPWRPYRP